MATREEQEANRRLLGSILGVILLSVFLINTFFVYCIYNKKYGIKDADYRVNDSLQFMSYLVKGAIPILIFILTLIAMMVLGSPDKIYIANIIFYLGCIVSLVWMFTLSARIATKQIGMLIYEDKGTFVIPGDPNNNTLLENLCLKFIVNLCTMEELPLYGITKITRQGGTTAFIHGTFGTRCVKWRNKQKRDECIAALETARNVNFSGMDFNGDEIED